MALPTSIAAKAFIDFLDEEERAIKKLLCRWVSGFEPSLIYDDKLWQVRGLGVKDDPTGTIMVHRWPATL